MKYYVESRRKGISYMLYNKRRLTGLVRLYVGTALQKHVIEEKIEGMGRRGRRHQHLLGTLRKGEGTGTWKKKH